MQSLEPLRKCCVCGLEANSEIELKKFVKNAHCRYNRQNYCKNCKNKMRSKDGKYEIATKENHKKSNSRTIKFLGKKIFLEKNPRTNICSQCERKYPNELKQQTIIHHDEYDEKNPLSYTREVCRSCHDKIHGFGKIH